MSRILVVDDAATVRLYQRQLLEQAGFLVDEAMNGLEAQEQIARHGGYDLYLVDVNMPLQDGYGFLRALRAMPISPAPAVVISTEAAAIDRERAYAAGANFYLVKPIRPDLLLQVCQRFLAASLGLADASQRAVQPSNHGGEQ
jgi:two-component system chemotaxis response regulator CheY